MTGRLFCYYGDDFTGSTDALEALAANGVETVLFLDVPSDAALARFPNCRAIGVAGDSRSRSPEWMTAHLPVIFKRLSELNAGMCQYKVCSTFDSSPSVGSIGRAIEIGRDAFHAEWVPVAIAAPHLGRYVLFGNLFAAVGGEIHRIDRHPTMRSHPVTPMDEADLQIHLARQTQLKIQKANILEIGQDRTFDSVVLFDGLDEQSQKQLGAFVWRRARFAVGSSGLTLALVHQWQQCGEIQKDYVAATAQAVDRLVVVSGSLSPVTQEQIRWAMNHGFSGIRVTEHSATLNGALQQLREGKSIVLYTALGAADRDNNIGGEELGRRLGVLLREVLAASGVRRAVIAGGDTSSFAVRQLGMDALTFVARLTPGAPLCRCEELELVLKGGQIGPPNFFEIARTGKQ